MAGVRGGKGSCIDLFKLHHHQYPLQFLSPHAIAVRTPQSPRPGEVDITLVYKGSQFCINSPGKFLYISKLTLAICTMGWWLCVHIGTSSLSPLFTCIPALYMQPLAPDDNTFDHNFARIERLLRSHEDPENLRKVSAVWFTVYS